MLIGLAWRRLVYGLRWAFGAALLAMLFPIAATFIVVGEINDAANLAALQRTLIAPKPWQD